MQSTIYYTAVHTLPVLNMVYYKIVKWISLVTILRPQSTRLLETLQFITHCGPENRLRKPQAHYVCQGRKRGYRHRDVSVAVNHKKKRCGVCNNCEYGPHAAGKKQSSLDNPHDRHPHLVLLLRIRF